MHVDNTRAVGFDRYRSKDFNPLILPDFTFSNNFIGVTPTAGSQKLEEIYFAYSLLHSLINIDVPILIGRIVLRRETCFFDIAII